jgi:hypothetical protein
MLEIPESKPIRAFRLEANYTAARLNALDETRHLATDFEEAADKFALLEEEEGRLDIRRVETQAMVETADDAWDDAVMAFQRRLLDLSGNSVDAELYRRYFADIPSHVTSLSYAAEIMISKDLERHLEAEESEELSVFSERLAEKRRTLENIIHERTRLEVDQARFQNRVALAKAILNKLRRILWASLEEVAMAKTRGADWCARFFWAHNQQLQSMDEDGFESRSEPSATNGEAAVTSSSEAGPSASAGRLA